MPGYGFQQNSYSWQIASKLKCATTQTSLFELNRLGLKTWMDSNLFSLFSVSLFLRGGRQSCLLLLFCPFLGFPDSMYSPGLLLSHSSAHFQARVAQTRRQARRWWPVGQAGLVVHLEQGQASHL